MAKDVNLELICQASLILHFRKNSEKFFTFFLFLCYYLYCYILLYTVIIYKKENGSVLKRLKRICWKRIRGLKRARAGSNPVWSAINALVVKLVYTLDWGSNPETGASSSLVESTIQIFAFLCYYSKKKQKAKLKK